MNSLNRKWKIFIVGILLFLIVGILIFYLWYSNDAYKNSPLEALEFSKNNPTVDVNGYTEEDLYNVRKLLEVVTIERYAYIIYISEVDTFTVATCSYSEIRNKWIHIGIAYEESLDVPQSLIWTYNNNILKGSREGNAVLGFRFHDENLPYVDEKKAQIKFYEVNFKGKNYQIEFWWILGITDENYTIEFK